MPLTTPINIVSKVLPTHSTDDCLSFLSLIMSSLGFFSMRSSVSSAAITNAFIMIWGSELEASYVEILKQ